MSEENKKNIKIINVSPPQKGEEQIQFVIKGESNTVVKIVDKDTVIKKRVTIDEVTLRDENVQEILTSTPHWMIRWGNILFLFLVLMLLFISWMIKYPNIVKSEVIIKNKYPKESIIYTENFNIKEILVEENQFVNINTPLIIKENNADRNNVFLLAQVIDTIVITSNAIQFPFEKLPELSLGEVQISFIQFQSDYQLFSRNKANKDNFKKVLISFEKLRHALNKWNTDYVIKAPISGNVQINKNILQIKKGDTILEIIPNNKETYIGKIISNNTSFEKIKKDQKVNIYLAAYPDHENGFIRGIVNNIFWDKSVEKYIVEINLPQGLKTTYGVNVNPYTNLNGTAEIVIRKKRLIERFFKL